jgi:predicted Zn-dependent peptidase
MALCVVGDIEPSKVLDIALKTLPKEPGEIPERDYGPPEACLPVNARVEKAMEVSLPIFLAGCKAKPAAHGQDTLWLELVSALALEVLAGHSSPLYLRLYGEGLINADFSASFDLAVGAAYSMFGGETRDPQRVYDEVIKEILKVSEHGPDAALFARIKKAAIGSYIRSFNSFSAISANVIEGHFRGYDTFNVPELLSNVTTNEVTGFLRENLLPENMAMSIITPKQ